MKVGIPLSLAAVPFAIGGVAFAVFADDDVAATLAGARNTMILSVATQGFRYVSLQRGRRAILVTCRKHRPGTIQSNKAVLPFPKVGVRARASGQSQKAEGQT